MYGTVLELTIPVDKTRIATISISVRWWCVPAINLVPRRQNAPWGYAFTPTAGDEKPPPRSGAGKLLRLKCARTKAAARHRQGESQR